MTSESILTVAVYQPEAKTETPHDRLRRLELVPGQPADRDCDLLVCPELYMSGYFVNDQIFDRAEPSVIASPLGEDLVRAGPNKAIIKAHLDRANISQARSRLRFRRAPGCVF